MSWWIFSIVLGIIPIVAAMLLITSRLLRRLDAKDLRLKLLEHQLRRTSYLSATMELSMGFFEEIKDIFANIDMSVKVLSDRSSPEKTSDLKTRLAQIAGESARGHNLIDRFSKFVRDEDPVVSDVPVNDLLDDLTGFFHRELIRRGIEVVRDFQQPPPRVRSDRGKLRQVLQNLFLNAVSALENGGRIHLKTRTEESRVTVTVGDNGPGIPAGNINRIFEPLFTTDSRNCGLGLSICKTILEQLGGAIEVNSRPASGSEFIIRLPYRMQ